MLLGLSCKVRGGLQSRAIILVLEEKLIVKVGGQVYAIELETFKFLLKKVRVAPGSWLQYRTRK